jgi:cAMP phosphodiesterase
MKHFTPTRAALITALKQELTKRYDVRIVILNDLPAFPEHRQETRIL